MDLLPKVFRTEGNIADFDPSKIYESILKETGISEKDAKHITELVVRRIIRSGIEFLSGPHIREIVCSILSEQHFENERKLYTRIGMPLMDYEQILQKNSKRKAFTWINPEKIHHWAANQIAEEYAHLRILTNKESKAHLAGDIHINGLSYFVLRPFSQVWDPRLILKNGLPPIKNLKGIYKYTPPKNLKSALFQLHKWLEMVKDEFYGNQGFNYINIFLAPYIVGLTKEEIIKEIHSFIYENNLTSFIIGRESPPISIFSSISILKELMDRPAIVSDDKIQNVYGEYNKQCILFFNALLQTFKDVIQKYPQLSFPKHHILLDYKFMNSIEDIFPKFWEDIDLISSSYFMNPTSYYYGSTNFEDIIKGEYQNYGILQNISLNLPRYAFATKDEDEFLELLRAKLLLCSNILSKKYEIIKKRIDSNHLPLCGITINGENIFKLENQGLSVSLVGLNEAIKYLTNYHLHEDLGNIELGKIILSKINQICKELSDTQNKTFIVSENPSERAIKRFTVLDLKKFPSEVNFVCKKRNYTNSIHFREDIDIDLIDKVKIQEDFHKYIHHGAISYISLKYLKRNKLNIKDFISKIVKESKISNLKFYE
jgi:ribonucleoside-triphosphate reductase